MHVHYLQFVPNTEHNVFQVYPHLLLLYRKPDVVLTLCSQKQKVFVWNAEIKFTGRGCRKQS